MSGGGQQAGLQRPADDASTTAPPGNDVDGFWNVGTRLQGRPCARNRALSRRSSRGLAYVGAACARGKVRRRRVCRKAVAARTFRRTTTGLGQQLLHPGLLGLWSGRTSFRVARSRPIVAGPHVRMPNEGPIRLMADPRSGGCTPHAVAPGLVFLTVLMKRARADDLHPREQVTGVWAVDVNGRRRTRTHHHRRHPWRSDSDSEGALSTLDVVVGGCRPCQAEPICRGVDRPGRSPLRRAAAR